MPPRGALLRKPPQPSHEVAKDEGFDLVGVAHVDEETRDRIAAGLDEDPAFFLPPSVENVKVWGDTLITMDKYQKQNVSYRDLVVSAYAGNAEAKYLTKIYNTYLNAGFERLSQGMECKTQAPDLAMYLARTRFRLGEKCVGFKRETKKK